MFQGDPHPVVGASKSADFITANIAGPTPEVKDLCVVDILSTTHDSTSPRGVVTLFHTRLLLKQKN